MDHDTPNQKIILFSNPDRAKVIIGRHQPAAVTVNFYSLNGKLSINKTDGYLSDA